MGGGKAVVKASPNARLDLPTPKVEFRDVAAAAGLTAPNVYGGVNTKKYILEMTGNGVAIFVFDNEGRPDLFLTQGTRLEGNPRRSVGRVTHIDGNCTFHAVAEISRLVQVCWASV